MKKIIITTLLSILPLAVLAGQGSEVAAKIKEKFPKLILVEEPRELKPGLFSFFVDGQLTFTDKNVSYMLTGGSLVDATTVKDITTQIYTERYKTAFQNLPINMAITSVYGKGTQTIALFIDPDCPYCKLFERTLEMNKNNLDLTVHRFFLPLTIHPGSMALSKKIVCSSNPEKAVLDYMVYEKSESIDGNENCAKSSNVEFTNALARSYQFRGTPTILFSTNTIAQGNVSYEDLKTALDDIKSKK